MRDVTTSEHYTQAFHYVQLKSEQASYQSIMVFHKLFKKSGMGLTETTCRGIASTL